MNGFAATLILLLNFALLPYFLYLFIVAAAALLPRRKVELPAAPTSRFLIVIPAHDEGSVISSAVRSCISVDYPRALFDVLVIADNCSDETADLARVAGARVVERFDETHKSKGHAIEFLIDRLQQDGELDGLGALVIVDADTSVDPGLLAAFDHNLRSGHDWIQAYYTVANPDESWRTRLLTYAFSLFNGVMPLGKTRLGLGALLKGNGMCFSVRGLKRVPWHCSGLVEDMEFAWVLRLAGEKVEFQPDVSVYGAMLPGGGQAAANQRRRWEFGRAEIRKKYFRPVLQSKRLDLWNKVTALCDLTIPAMSTFALLCLLVAAIDVLYLFCPVLDNIPWIRPLLVGSLVVMGVSVGLYGITPIIIFRLPWRYLLATTAFPFYLIWRLRVSSGGRPGRWVRTPRDPVAEIANHLAWDSHHGVPHD